uniref:Zinc finger CW-type and PWWP domain containing 1 n=1 Tax=Microcebus murinus TaxID=30608 RepID=A0A8C5UMQ8_MICMU
MMTTLQNKEECGKRPKKIFAPPVQKLHSLILCSTNSPKEETLGISSPETETRPHLPKARLEKKEEKATTENGPSSGQKKKGKAQDNKQVEKKEKSSISNEEFEEIVQIVLRKSLQECLGMGSGFDFAETSCAQPIVCTQSDKEPAITASATDNDTADREKVMVPHTPEIPASQDNDVVSAISTSKLGQPDLAPSGKKFNRLPLSKRKKEAHEKMEKVQGGHEHRQKDQRKKMVQDHSHIRNQQKRKQSGFGQCLIWVQCSSPNCEKWRRLRGNIDPAVLPDNWSCDQNTDLEYNSCDIPEETWTGHESDIAYASYIPGSIIWAKQYGYPWWPGMVESDPDLGEYFLFYCPDSLPSKSGTFKVVWNKDCSQKLGAALIMAQEAEQISIQERVNLFGFRSRYNGSDSSGEGKGRISGGRGLEKEGRDSFMRPDPTLSGPKSIKTQTKKPKPRGKQASMANGQGGTLKRKTVKRSLGSESTAPPASITGKKEGHGNSDSDKLGPKKKFKTPEIKASATSLSEEIESRMVPQGLSPPARARACASARKEGPRFQESLTQEVGSVPHEDEASSDLDLELLMEDIGKEPEQRGEPQHRDDEEEFTVAFFEE